MIQEMDQLKVILCEQPERMFLLRPHKISFLYDLNMLVSTQTATTQ